MEFHICTRLKFCFSPPLSDFDFLFRRSISKFSFFERKNIAPNWENLVARKIATYPSKIKHCRCEFTLHTKKTLYTSDQMGWSSHFVQHAHQSTVYIIGPTAHIIYKVKNRGMRSAVGHADLHWNENGSYLQGGLENPCPCDTSNISISSLILLPMASTTEPKKYMVLRKGTFSKLWNDLQKLLKQSTFMRARFHHKEILGRDPWISGHETRNLVIIRACLALIWHTPLFGWIRIYFGVHHLFGKLMKNATSLLFKGTKKTAFYF